VLLLQYGCVGEAAIQLCGEIPTGGCPIGRGGTCDDLSCSGLYDCVSGAWKRVKACDTNGTSSSSSSSTGTGGAPSCAVTIDRSKEITGCASLETPDCPADAADSCTACEGCEDFFLCESADANHPKGWVAVAYCDADGHVVVSQP